MGFYWNLYFFMGVVIFIIGSLYIKDLAKAARKNLSYAYAMLFSCSLFWLPIVCFVISFELVLNLLSLFEPKEV